MLHAQHEAARRPPAGQAPPKRRSAAPGSRAESRGAQYYAELASRQASEQVLLLVRDAGELGPGVPVIGRRLPSKSAGGYRCERVQEVRRPSVLGRRLQQAQHQLRLAEEQPPATAGVYRGQPLVGLLDPNWLGEARARQRPSSGAAPGCWLRASPLPVGSPALLLPAHDGPQLVASRARFASSCSSLCSANQSAEGCACCQEAAPGSRAPYAAGHCQRDCCLYAEEVQQQQQQQQQMPPRIAGIAGKQASRRRQLAEQQQQQPMEPSPCCRADCCEAPPVVLLSSRRLSRQSQQLPGGGHGRASSCHAPRRSQAAPPALVGHPEAPLRISGRQLMPVGQPLLQPIFQVPLEARHLVPAAGRVAAAEAELLQRGRHRRKQTGAGQPASSSPQLAPSSSQIYESLAAELKAKLGDRRLAPILLPPKDYDTMTRRQGKLNGIESRASTHPQLVGPHRIAARSSDCVGPATGADGEREPGCMRSPRDHEQGCESARSSARRSLSQESRSNSSSGLGSISVGAGSPASLSSSKCSSRDDMSLPQTKRAPLHPSTSSDGSRCKQTLRAPSSDNCGASDSGHSESGATGSNRSAQAKTEAHMNLCDNLERLALSSNTRTIEEQPANRANSVTGRNGGSSTSSSSSSSSSSGSNLANNYAHTKENGAKNKNSKAAILKEATSSSSSSSSVIQTSDNGSLEESTRLYRGKGIHNHHPSGVSEGVLWNGRVEVPLKVNSAKNLYLATKQIIY